METRVALTPPRRSAFKKDGWALLDGIVLADDFDKHLDKFYARGGADRALLIDFTRATYIEIAALSNCIAALVQRTELGYQTFLGLPTDSRVRDFLRVWRFADAIEQATGCSIQEFLVLEDRGSNGGPQDTYTGVGDAINKLEYDPDWSAHKRSARNFFEFITFNEDPGMRIGPGGRFASAPREEGRKWTRPLIHQVLEKHLPGDTTKDEVARVIIYEAMSNAVRHPSAKTIQIVSKVERPGERQEGSSGFLRICVWDDGQSIAQTLLDALNEGRSIHAFNLPSFMCDRVHVTVRSFDKSKRSVHFVDQSDKITGAPSEGRVLLASLFPGVTRTVAKEVAKVEPFEDAPSKDASISELIDFLGSAPGMGLYALTRTAVDQFGGSLVIRSGSYRLIIESAHDTYRAQHGVRYKCKITQYGEYVPSFKGNLLTVQLPLKG